MIYEEENPDFCELFESALDKGDDKTLEYCELCELQRKNERMISDLTTVDMKEVKVKMRK